LKEKSAVEQDSKAKALTAAQKLENYTKLYNKQQLKSRIISAITVHTNSK